MRVKVGWGQQLQKVWNWTPREQGIKPVLPGADFYNSPTPTTTSNFLQKEAEVVSLVFSLILSQMSFFLNTVFSCSKVPPGFFDRYLNDSHLLPVHTPGFLYLPGQHLSTHHLAYGHIPTLALSDEPGMQHVEDGAKSQERLALPLPTSDEQEFLLTPHGSRPLPRHSISHTYG